MYAAALVFYFLIPHCTSFVLPTDVVELIFILTSKLPLVKAGVDSRLGFGFRLGRHADYQTLIEIGPQITTNPISSNGTTTSSRRSTPLNPFYRLFNGASKYGPGKPGSSQTDNSGKTVVGNIEFNKIPGIDGIRKRKVKNPKNAVRGNPDSPTKFVLLP